MFGNRQPKRTIIRSRSITKKKAVEFTPTAFFIMYIKTTGCRSLPTHGWYPPADLGPRKTHGQAS